MKKTDTDYELLLTMAIGRLFRLGSRPFQEGDEETFGMVRMAVMEAAAALGISEKHSLNYVAHRMGRKGEN